MKIRRRTFLRSALLLHFAAGVFSLPAVHWRLIGWWRGEAFYQDRPTSWWAQEIQQSYTYSYGARSADRTTVGRISVYWYRRSTQSLGDKLRQQIDGPPSINSLVEAMMADPPLLDGDEQALPVLCELLRHDDPKGRLLAAGAWQRWASKR